MPGAGPAPVTSYVPPATQFAPPAAAAPPPPPQPMPVVAERRVALVIGNASYARLGVLRNPLNDARAVSASLRRVGFDVATVENGDHRTMMRAISEFGNRIGNGGVGLFYYAGHAVQVRGANYLIPVDANIQAESEVDFLAVNAGLAFAQYDKANAKLGVTILDSCRDNPLPQAFRSMSRGLAVVGNAPPGSLVVYATGPGQVAADGSGANSVFTEALLQNLERPGIKAQDMFNAVAVSVSQKSQGRQVPWISATGIQDDFFFRR
ncbi:MAG: caspase family protein [Verrucomicrobia bacterium]|nr:caspase family protein [Verrucomicrobiota bacterium]